MRSKRFVVAVMGGAQVGGHLLGVVEIGDGRGKMRLAGQQDVLGAAVRSALFFSVSLGTGKVFQPSVLE